MRGKTGRQITYY